MFKRSVLLGLTLGTVGTAVLGCGGHQPDTYDVPPVLANRDEVTAALRAMGGGLEAQVVLLVHVGREGEVREVRIQRGSGDDGLDEAAIWVGERMRFQPAKYEGRPVSAWVTVPVTFDVVSAGDRGPRLRNGESIAATMAEEHADLDGSARLRVRVDAAGVVTNTREGRAESSEMLQAAERLARSLEFWPARRGFKPVDAWITVVFEFDGPRSQVRLETRGSD